jgi:hypothetical protein
MAEANIKIIQLSGNPEQLTQAAKSSKKGKTK